MGQSWIVGMVLVLFVLLLFVLVLLLLFVGLGIRLIKCCGKGKDW